MRSATAVRLALVASLAVSYVAPLGLAGQGPASAATCENDGILFIGEPIGGIVTEQDRSDWYIAVPTPAVVTYFLFPTSVLSDFADADLYVYRPGCQLICSSTHSLSIPDTCSVLLPSVLDIHWIEVRYFSSSTGQAAYVLTRA